MKLGKTNKTTNNKTKNINKTNKNTYQKIK